MKSKKHVVGFMGAGGIARAHAYSLSSLKYYYNPCPEIELNAVCSASSDSRQGFADKYGFQYALSPEEFVRSGEINTVFILGPNNVHYEHLEAALNMPSVTHIYLEKPVCSSLGEENKIHRLMDIHKDKTIQVGFQFIQAPAIRQAYGLWKSGKLGKPIHFEVKYYHGDYLKKSYRDKRASRLTPAPDGGAMADLGSHAISLLLAFMGNDVRILHASKSGKFPDVPEGSDLFSSLSLFYPESKVAGTLAASRISAGTADLFAFEFFAENGALKYSSHQPDFFMYYLEDDGKWHQMNAGSNYPSITSFPSGHVPAGWLRSMIHAHYLFLGGRDDEAFTPDIFHGLAVQRIISETAEFLSEFRNSRI